MRRDAEGGIKTPSDGLTNQPVNLLSIIKWMSSSLASTTAMNEGEHEERREIYRLLGPSHPRLKGTWEGKKWMMEWCPLSRKYCFDIGSIFYEASFRIAYTSLILRDNLIIAFVKWIIDIMMIRSGSLLRRLAAWRDTICSIIDMFLSGPWTVVPSTMRP